MKRALSMMVATCLYCAASANAAVLTQSDTYSFPLSPNSAVLTFDQFDPSLGTLISVKIEIEATISANVAAENDAVIAGNMGVGLTGLTSAAVPSGLTANAGILASAGPVPVSATDGVSDSGPDYHDFGLLTGSNTAMSTIFVGLAPYVGLGSINVNVNGSGGFSVSGVADSTISVTQFAGEGEVTVTYEYAEQSVVPEPGTFAIFGLGFVGLIGWRRRRFHV